MRPIGLAAVLAVAIVPALAHAVTDRRAPPVFARPAQADAAEIAFTRNARDAPRRGASTARREIAQIQGGGCVGIRIQALTPALQETMGAQEVGALVASISPAGPAEEVGLSPGDIILEINRARTETIQQVVKLVHDLEPGTLTLMRIERKGVASFVTVTVGRRGTEPKYCQRVARTARTSRSPDVAPESATPPAPTVDIAKIQRLLADLGHDPGPIDGVMGSRTRDAIRTYQRDRGLGVDGKPSAALLARLRNDLVESRAAGKAGERPTVERKPAGLDGDLGDLDSLD